MDSLTFWAEIARACAWPLVALLLGAPALWVLRGLVNGLKLKRLKQGDWEAEFDSQVAELTKVLPASGKAQRQRRLGIGGAQGGSVAVPLGSHVEGSPTEAVLAAWATVERDLRALAASRNVDANATFGETLDVLVSKGALTDTDASSIMGLRQLRNLAVHGPPGELPTNRAQEFVSMADAIRWVLSTKRVSEQVG